LYLSTHVNYTEGSYRILSTRVYEDLRKIGNSFITNGGPFGVQKGRLRMAKRSDVARAAGVAESTISYALSGSRPISEETKSRILKAMKDLDYKPNAVAAALRSGSSKMLALVFGVTDKGITQGDISYLLGAADAARELGYHLILWPARDRDIDDVIAQAQSGLLDGVVLMEVRLEDARVKLFRKLGIPVALIGRTSKPEKDIYADRDFDGAVRLAIEELVRLGHKKIEYLSTSTSQVEEGFGAIVRAENLAIEIAKEHKVKLNIMHCEISVEAGVELAGTYLKKNNSGTAIVSINSEAVAGFSRAIQKAGKRVPEDISIICIDSSEREAVAQVPALTTISPPAADIGSAAVTSLIKNLAHLDIEDPQQLWRGDLVTRGSTGPAPK
jgi:DNA-binding LacI/PurR family transcriptional regulator